MSDKDFDTVRRYVIDWYDSTIDSPSDYGWPNDGDWVKYEDYQELLAAYKELKWMYEELCK